MTGFIASPPADLTVPPTVAALGRGRSGWPSCSCSRPLGSRCCSRRGSLSNVDAGASPSLRRRASWSRKDCSAAWSSGQQW